MKIVGVIGGSKVTEEIYNIAYEMGKLIGGKGYALVTGGLGGVMEAASKGAKEEGGLVIGILPGSSKESANRWVDIPILTGMGHARNVIIVQTADILIAIDGALGTQSEIAFAKIYDKKIIGIKCDLPIPIEKANSPKEAIKKIEEFFSKNQNKKN
ncbi:MAG: TIGR00725 family protein [candidate division WOR-3 bacterium]